MDLCIRKASFLKRFGAGLLDAILLCILATAVAFVLSYVFGYDSYSDELNAAYNEYELEYGTAAIEINADSIKPGQKVVIIDDLIATGGTAAAAAKLVEKLGGEVVKIVFMIELKGLEGRKALEGYEVESLVAYEGK